MSWVYVLEGTVAKKRLTQAEAKKRLMLIVGTPQEIIAAHRGAAPTGEGEALFFKLSDRGEDLFAARGGPGRSEWRRLDRIPTWDRQDRAPTGLRRFLPW
jgi:hypothetical protein